MKWYKRDPDAALAGMAELSLEERGAYNSILDLLYSRDGALPDDDETVARLMSVAVRTWRRLKRTLMERGKIWRTSDGTLANVRVMSVLAEAATLSEHQRKIATQRWENYRKTKQNNDAPVPGGTAERQYHAVVPTTTTTTTTTREEAPLPPAANGHAEAKPKRQRRQRQQQTPIPESFEPRQAEIDFGKAKGLDVAACLDHFRSHFRSNGEHKADWDATFRNWLRREKPSTSTAYGRALL